MTNFESNLLTKCFDTEKYLFDFFDLETFFVYALLSKINNHTIKQYSIYQTLLLYKSETLTQSYDNLAHWVCKNGYCPILDFLKKCDYQFDKLFTSSYFINKTGGIDVAAKEGNINILNWFVKNNIKFKYTDWSIDWAASNGHEHILNWFHNNDQGYQFIYTHYAIDWASREGHIHILDWFDKSEYSFLYTKYAVDLAASRGHIKVLDWFKNAMHKCRLCRIKHIKSKDPSHICSSENGICGLEFRYTSEAMDYASKYGHINVLEWFKNSGMKMKYTHDSMNFASENGQIIVLNWWKQHAMESEEKLKYDNHAIDFASMNGHIDILEWWKKFYQEQKIEPEYTSWAIDYAVRYKHLNVLQWWKESGLNIKYTYHAIKNAEEYGYIFIIDWLNTYKKN